MGGEELLEIEAPWWATPSRRVQTIAAILCALLLACGVVALLQRQSAHRPHPSPIRPLPVGQHVDSAIEHVAVRCPVGATCQITSTVPSSTSDVISVGLPGGRQRSHYSVIRTDANGLIYRSVNATIGLVELLVIISKPSSLDRTPIAATTSPGATIGYVRQYHRGFEIQVQFTGPPGYQPPIQLARAVASDPRLLVLV